MATTIRSPCPSIPEEAAAARRTTLVRVGETPLELRLLTVEQAEQALSTRGEAGRQGIDRSVGAWLHDRCYLDLVQVQQIMAAMGDANAGRLIPDIQLLQLLGRGTSGAVYRGWSSTLGCDVA